MHHSGACIILVHYRTITVHSFGYLPFSLIYPPLATGTLSALMFLANFRGTPPIDHLYATESLRRGHVG